MLFSYLCCVDLHQFGIKAIINCFLKQSTICLKKNKTKQNKTKTKKQNKKKSIIAESAFFLHNQPNQPTPSLNQSTKTAPQEDTILR
jgi:hypothetical protein